MKSKLLLSILVAVGTLRVAVVPVVAADALTLSNPGFENQLTDWDSQEDNGMSKVIAEAAHAGKFGLRVTDDSDTAGSSVISRRIPVTEGKTYQVQFFARVLSGEGIGVYLRFLKADGKPIVLTSDEEKTADQKPVVQVDKNQLSWLQFTGKKTAPNEAATAVIFIHSYSKHKVTADFDDFAVAEVAK